MTLPSPRQDERLVLGTCTDGQGRRVFSYTEWDPERPVMHDRRLVWGLDADAERQVTHDGVCVTCRNRRFPDA